MTLRRLLQGILGPVIALLLVVTLAALVYGHLGGGSCGLSLTDSYITEYLKMAPHWPWVVVASFSFALMLFLLSLAFLMRAGSSPLLLAGCLLLAATSMANFFASYAPVRRVEQPPPTANEWWTPTWWFTSRTSRTPYEHGMADAYSDVHYRATRLVVASGCTGILLLALGHLGRAGSRRFALVTLATVPVMSFFFLMGDHLEVNRGLWQRIGFAMMYGWLWTAWRECSKPSADDQNAP